MPVLVLAQEHVAGLLLLPGDTCIESGFQEVLISIISQD